MPLLYPDILENNNTNFPLINVTSVKGTAYPLASISNTGSIPADKRNVGAIVFDSGSGKFYGFKGSSVSNWNTGSNWIEFGSGSGGGSTDLTALNNFTGSMYVTSSQAVHSISEINPFTISYDRWDGSNQGATLLLSTRNIVYNFTSSANTRLGNLEAATGSYVTNAKTGSFLYSGSYDSTTSALTLYSKSTNYTLDLSGLAGGGGGGFAITASNEGTVLTENARTFDFVGNAVTATNIGSAVTVTINTGSASTSTNIYNSDGTLTGNRSVLGVDKTLLFQMSGSSQFLVSDGPLVGPGQTWTFQVDNQGVYLDGLLSNTPTDNIVAYDSVSTKLSYFSTSSLKTDITALNNFTGSTNTRLSSLEAATGSYVTNAQTGSFYYSSSISSNIITFNQGDGTTESITIESIPSASFAPNIYNSNGTLPTGTRRVFFGDSSILRFDLSSSIAGSPRVAFDTNTITSGVRFAGTGYVQLDTSAVTMANIANTVQPDILGRDSLGNITYFSTSSLVAASANTGSLLATGSVSNATLTFTKGNGSTFPLTINNVANATVAGSVTSDSVYGEAGTNFNVWTDAGGVFTLLNVNGTDIQAIAPKTVEGLNGILAVATMEVFRSSSAANHTTFQYRMYNSTQAVTIPGSTREFSSYLSSGAEGTYATTFTFTVPISSDITSGDTIELQVRENPSAVLGTYSSASISYADLALVNITQ